MRGVLSEATKIILPQPQVESQQICQPRSTARDRRAAESRGSKQARAHNRSPLKKPGPPDARQHTHSGELIMSVIRVKFAAPPTAARPAPGRPAHTSAGPIRPRAETPCPPWLRRCWLSLSLCSSAARRCACSLPRH